MTSSPTIHELIQMSGEGSQDAFSELYQRMRQPVFKYLMSRFASDLSKEDVEDIIQNTFIAISLHASQYRGMRNDGSAKAWIRTIARNQALKMLHSLRHMPLPMDDDEDDDSIDPEGGPKWSDPDWKGENSVENRTFTRSLISRVFSANTLSNEEIELIELRYKEGYTFEQIGRHFGRTKPRAKQRHDGIIQKFRRILGLEDKD